MKFLSGLQTGRVVLVLSNTANSLTLDTSDNSIQVVPLTTSSFSVAVGDTFEIFPGDTLSLLFGSNTQESPLLLKPGTTIANADMVTIYNPVSLRYLSYYFDSSAGFWKLYGSTVNANNTILYPDTGFAITRRASEPAISFTLMGRVSEVNHLIKTTGSNTFTFNSTGYPVDLTLSQLQLGANWTMGANDAVADTLSIWNNAALRFDTYFQLPDTTWRKYEGGSTDQSNFIISAGTAVIYTKRGSARGSTSYLQPTLPYSLD